MNVLSTLCLIAATAQMVGPGAQAQTAAIPVDPQLAGEGWHRNSDSSLSYIVNISPDDVRAIADGRELALVIPPFIRPDISQVIVRIGNATPEREPPEAELIEQQRLRAAAGSSLTLNTLENRGGGQYRNIDPPGSGRNPLQPVTQFSTPTAGSVNPATANFSAPTSTFGSPGSQANSFPAVPSTSPPLTSRNPAVTGQRLTDAAVRPNFGATSGANGFASTDPPSASMFPQPQQQTYASNSQVSVTSPLAGAAQYPTTPLAPPRIASNDGFGPSQSYGLPSQGSYNSTGTPQSTFPANGAQNSGLYVGAPRDQNGFGTSSSTSPFQTTNNQGYPFNDGRIAGTNGGFAGGQNAGGQQYVNQGYGSQGGTRLADAAYASGGFPTSNPQFEKTYTSNDVDELTKRSAEQMRQGLTQQYLSDLNKQLQVKEEQVRTLVEQEQAKKASLWQFLLLLSIVLNCYLFVLMKRLFERYRSLQANARHNMTLAT